MSRATGRGPLVSLSLVRLFNPVRKTDLSFIPTAQGTVVFFPQFYLGCSSSLLRSCWSGEQYLLPSAPEASQQDLSVRHCHQPLRESIIWNYHNKHCFSYWSCIQAGWNSRAQLSQTCSGWLACLFWWREMKSVHDSPPINAAITEKQGPSVQTSVLYRFSTVELITWTQFGRQNPIPHLKTTSNSNCSPDLTFHLVSVHLLLFPLLSS